MNNVARFQIAYWLLGVGVGVMLTALIFTGKVPEPKVIYKKGTCPIITEKTYPNIVDRCIAGKLGTKGKFSQSDLGLPQDGYCEDHTNGLSWRVIKCLGTQPESQP